MVAFLDKKETTDLFIKYLFNYAAYNADTKNITNIFTPPPRYGASTQLMRKVLPEDVRKMNMKLMPGFNLTWYYTGSGVVEPEAHYQKDTSTKAFVRNSSKLI